MATYNPKLSLSAAPGITGYLYLELYEATAPTVAVAMSAQIAPPHTSSVQIQFTGLNPVNHIAKLFETNGTAPTGTLLANFSLDPQFPVVELRSPLFIYAGTTSGFVSTSKTYIDAGSTLKGWDYTLEIRGVGKLDPAVDYTVDANNNPAITDNTVFNPGVYSIQPGEVWVLIFQPKLITYSNVSTGGLFNVSELITANRTLVAGDIGKAFVCSGATSTLEITLPDLSTVSENKPTIFMMQSVNNPNTVVKCTGIDTIIYLGTILNKLILADSESLWIYKFAGVWFVMNELAGVKNVGQIVHSYETAFYNTVYANGTLLDRDVYPRLWAYVQTLDASMLVSDASWSNAGLKNKGKFSTGDGSTTFRIPLLYEYGFLRGVNSAVRKAGSYEVPMVGEHVHDLPANDGSPSGSIGGPTYPTGADATVPSSTAVQKSGSEILVGTENRPANTAIYLSIRI